jgi:hypothetical protein
MHTLASGDADSGWTTEGSLVRRAMMLMRANYGRYSKEERA